MRTLFLMNQKTFYRRFLQRFPVDFAVREQGKTVHKQYIPGNLERRCPAAHQLPHLVLRHIFSFHNAGADLFRIMPVRHADDLYHIDTGILAQDVLYFTGGDVLAAADNQLFFRPVYVR